MISEGRDKIKPEEEEDDNTGKLHDLYSYVG